MPGSADPASDPARLIPGAVERVGNKRVIARRGLQIVEDLARKGYSDAFMAKALRMHPGTFREIRRRDDRVAAALEMGRAVLEAELVDKLLELARAGNVIAAIYLTKARCGWREGDAPDTRAGIVINLPAAVDAETYLAIVTRGTLDAGSPLSALGGVPLTQIEESKK